MLGMVLTWGTSLLGGLFKDPKSIIRFLSSPLGILLLICLAFFIGQFNGRRQEHAVALAEQARLNSRAGQIDASIQKDALDRRNEQVEAKEAVLARQQRELDAYAARIRTDAIGACAISDDDIGSVPDPGGAPATAPTGNLGRAAPR